MKLKVTSQFTEQQWKDFEVIHNDPSTGAVSMESVKAPFGTYYVIETENQPLIDWIQKNLTCEIIAEPPKYDDSLTDDAITKMIISKADLSTVRPERIISCTPKSEEQIAAENAQAQAQKDSLVSDIIEAQKTDGPEFQKSQDELNVMSSDDLIALHQLLDRKAQIIQHILDQEIPLQPLYDEKANNLNSIQDLQFQIDQDMQMQARKDPEGNPVPDSDMTKAIQNYTERNDIIDQKIKDIIFLRKGKRDELLQIAFADLQTRFTANLSAIQTEA